MTVSNKLPLSALNPRNSIDGRVGRERRAVLPGAAPPLANAGVGPVGMPDDSEEFAATGLNRFTLPSFAPGTKLDVVEGKTKWGLLPLRFSGDGKVNVANDRELDLEIRGTAMGGERMYRLQFKRNDDDVMFLGQRIDKDKSSNGEPTQMAMPMKTVSRTDSKTVLEVMVGGKRRTVTLEKVMDGTREQLRIEYDRTKLLVAAQR